MLIPFLLLWLCFSLKNKMKFSIQSLLKICPYTVNANNEICLLVSLLSYMCVTSVMANSELKFIIHLCCSACGIRYSV